MGTNKQTIVEYITTDVNCYNLLDQFSILNHNLLIMGPHVMGNWSEYMAVPRGIALT